MTVTAPVGAVAPGCAGLYFNRNSARSHFLSVYSGRRAGTPATMAEKQPPNFKVVADNRKARFNYEIGEVFEAGIALTGTEVKSLRQGKATIAESYADAKGGELWLINAN